MKLNKFVTATVVSTFAAAMAAPAFAGNDAPSGPHYNLNIIGVEKAKKSKMTGSNRHTIFVPLKSKVQGKSADGGTDIVDSKIWLTPGDDFRVCDGNGFDLAYGCDETFDGSKSWTYVDGVLVYEVSPKDGAVFQLPCNNNLDGETAMIDGQEVALEAYIDCSNVVTVDGDVVSVDGLDLKDGGDAEYEVWARALGSPKLNEDGTKPSANVTTCATVQGELQCSMENTVLTRNRGKSSFTEVTNELTSLVVVYDFDYDGDGEIDESLLTRVALFAGDTEDWFWNYDNNGLKLAQLRFYHLDDIKRR